MGFIKMLVINLLGFMFLTAVQAQGTVNVKGRVSEKRYDEIFVKHHLTNSKVSTSDVQADGSFSMSFQVKGADYYRLGFNDKEYLFLIPEAGENIEVQYNVNDPYSSVVSGSKQTELIIETFKSLKQYDLNVEEYKKKMEKEKEEYLRSTLKENSTSLANVLFLQNNFINLKENPDLYVQIVEDLAEAYPNNRFVNDLSKQVKSHNAAAIGAEAPEIALPNPQGEVVKLSSLRGKVVLIDFWASWCRPCRMENPNVVRVYNKFKDKGFDIYAVSLDRTKDSWVKAIQADNLTWTHVSDLKYWNSEVVGQYGISGIPFTVLIDKEGKIIAKGLRAEQLEQKLEQLLN